MDKSAINKETSLEVLKAMNNNDFTALSEVLDEDVVFDFPGVDLLKGRKRVILFLKTLIRKYPDLTFTVHDMICNEDKICAIWSNRGNDTQGNLYTNNGITVYIFRNGKIVFLSDYFKDTSFTQK